MTIRMLISVVVISIVAGGHLSAAIMLSPTTRPRWQSDDSTGGNLGPSDIDWTFFDSDSSSGLPSNPGDATTEMLLYKSESREDEGAPLGAENDDPITGSGAEQGDFWDSYSLKFTGVLDGEPDWNGFEITYDSGDTIPWEEELYLLIKDGNQEPARYLFDISNWDGTELIEGTGFWANASGSISNVALWKSGEEDNNDPSPVPAPGSVLVWSLLGLACGAYRARFRR